MPNIWKNKISIFWEMIKNQKTIEIKLIKVHSFHLIIYIILVPTDPKKREKLIKLLHNTKK